MGENIKYYIYKYNQLYNDWHCNLSNIIDNICIAEAIRAFCHASKSCLPQFVDSTQLNRMIGNYRYLYL